MASQDQVSVTIAAKAETTYGTEAGTSGAQYLRRVTSSLNLTKDAFQSNEVRSDQQVADMRHGTRRVAGNIEGELSLETYDDFMEACLRGTWTAGATFNAASGSGITVDNTAKTFTRASGSWLSDGFKIADIVRWTNLDAAIDNKNLRIAALTATVMTTVEAPGADVAVADEACSCSVQGRKLTVGTQKRSFTIEQVFPDIDGSELFSGVRVGQMDIALPPSGLATVNFGLQGKNGRYLEGSEAPYFSSPTEEPNTGIFSGLDGTIRVAGSDIAVLTGLNFSVNNNLNSQPVIGANTVPNIFYGRTVITGEMSAYLEDMTLLNAFDAESEISAGAVMYLSGDDPKDFLSFNFHRAKITGSSKTIGAEGGLIVTFPFQALLKSGGSGTAYDQSTMVIQRSNT